MMDANSIAPDGMAQPTQQPDGEAVLIVFVTCPPDTAEGLAVALVESGSAACVNVLPAVRSIYRWRDAIERSDEALLLIKTDAAHYPALEAEVRARHPYELPEIVAVHCGPGLPDYLKWVAESLT